MTAQQRMAPALPGLAFLWLSFMLVGSFGAQWVHSIATAPMQPPSLDHWLGTDLLGNDVFLRIVQGGGWTIGIAGLACLLSVTVGSLWGIAAGFFHNRGAYLLTRLLDVALAVPPLLMALVWIAAFGPSNGAVILAVGAGGVATFARLARAEAAHLSSREFILAARALGAGHARVIWRHLLPNMLASLAAYWIIQFGWALTNTAALTFLGFGGSLFTPDWGRLLGDARLVFWQAPWQALAAGLAIACTVLSAQKIGEHWIRPA
jgi:peptide/nickel transport system permease protein